MSSTQPLSVDIDVEASDWRQERRSNGTIKMAWRAFHVCEAGGRVFGPCGTLTPTTRLPMDEDSMSESILPGDRWYCACCGARVRATYTVLTEIWHDGSVYWMRSNSPMMEDSSPGAELAELVEQVQPHIGENDFIRLPYAGETPPGAERGIYKVVNTTAFADTRVWKCADVLKFIEHF